jgi:putative oxidoreductase
VVDFWVAAGVVARMSVALTFALAAFPKLWNPSAFAEGLLEYGIVSAFQARIASVVLPVAELALAVDLVIGWELWAGSLLACLLLGVFTLVAIRTLVQGRRLRCSCFGGGQGDYIGPGLIVRNVVLFGLLLMGLATTGTSVGSVHIVQVGSAVNWLAVLITVPLVFLLIHFAQFWELALHGKLPLEGQRRQS